MILSIMLILVLGMLASRLFTWVKLPGLIGMILVGIALGPYGFDRLDPFMLDNAIDTRFIALVVILLRAGLELEKDLLRSVGGTAIKMNAIPCLLEGFTVAGAAYLLLDLPLVEAGMLGFVLAAVSPAVIVPAMLRLREQGWGMRQGVPNFVLAGASVDDVFAIILFTAFLGMALRADGSFIGQMARIPVQIVGGILLGAIIGLGMVLVFRRLSISHLERVGVTVTGAFAVLLFGEHIGVAGLLGVMALGFVLLERVRKRAIRLEVTLNRVWFFAQLVLFALIGAEVDLEVAWQAGLTGLAIVAVGLLARSAGVVLALQGSRLTDKERLFAAIAYLPKATVQAAIGGIPLALGVTSGVTVLAIAVLAVVITASMGAVAIDVTTPLLLEKDRGGIDLWPPAGLQKQPSEELMTEHPREVDGLRTVVVSDDI